MTAGTRYHRLRQRLVSTETQYHGKNYSIAKRGHLVKCISVATQ